MQLCYIYQPQSKISVYLHHSRLLSSMSCWLQSMGKVKEKVFLMHFHMCLSHDNIIDIPLNCTSSAREGSRLLRICSPCINIQHQSVYTRIVRRLGLSTKVLLCTEHSIKKTSNNLKMPKCKLMCTTMNIYNKVNA